MEQESDGWQRFYDWLENALKATCDSKKSTKVCLCKGLKQGHRGRRSWLLLDDKS